MWGIIPASVLIFLVLGTIMMGLATPTEAGAMGAIGAIVLAVVRNAPLTLANSPAPRSHAPLEPGDEPVAVALRKQKGGLAAAP
mgnify:CR=1 FL=1